MLVDLVYDVGCPHVDAVRTRLREALGRCGLATQWEEHRIGDADVPARARGYGSPTILVEGRDVTGLAPGADTCCRLYAQGDVQAPAVEDIVAALRSARS